jgi:hypothetical protein
MIAMNIFLNYRCLNDSNVSLLFMRLTSNYANHTQNFHLGISKFLKFTQDNGFQLSINEEAIPNINDISAIELILDGVSDIIINEPVMTSYEKIYQFLMSRNINATLVQYSPSTEFSS